MSEKFTRLLEKILLLYILMLPIGRVPSLPVFKQKIMYADLIFALLFSLWLFKYFHSRRMEKIYLFGPIAIMLVALSFSFVNTNSWLLSAIEFVGILYLVLLFVIFQQVVLDEHLWRRIMKYWVIISLVLSMTGIVAYVFPSSRSLFGILVTQYGIYEQAGSHLTKRLQSTFYHPAMFSMYLHISLVFTFILLKDNSLLKKPEKWIYIVAIPLFLIAALLTKTRVNAGIGLTLFLVSLWYRREKRGGEWVALEYLTFFYFIFLFIAVFLTTIWWIFPIRFSMDSSKERLNVSLNTIHQTYFIQHKAAYDIFRDHPICGVGMGMYNYRSKDYVVWEEARRPFQMNYPDLREDEEYRYKWGHDPHSFYLGWGSETGWLGLGAILFSFFTYCVYGIDN